MSNASMPAAPAASSSAAPSLGGQFLQQALDAARVRHGVAGATLALLHEGRVHCVASGLLNLETGVEATPDSVFQIGSISKLFTATLLMQLADEDLVELDAPVRRYLPEFAVADAAAAQSITVRQLLAHTSGIDGDFFPPDDDSGPSAESYVRKMHQVPQLHGVGEYMTYCNSGYVVAGRIAEVLRGANWARLVMERICRLLGMRQAYAQPAEAIRYRSAMGHLPSAERGGALGLAPLTYLPLSIAAAGAVLSMSAPDLLRFAQAHIAWGEIPGGKLLSHAASREMARPQVAMPPHSRKGYSHMGLGWFLAEADGHRLIGHDGSTLGQMAYLHAVPDAGLAMALLTNSPSTLMADELKQDFYQLAGIAPQAEAPASNAGFDTQRYAGVYENVAARMEVRAGGPGLQFTATPRGLGSSGLSAGLAPHSNDCFELQTNDPALKGKLTFIGDDGGRARYVRLGMRMARRVG